MIPPLNAISPSPRYQKNRRTLLAAVAVVVLIVVLSSLLILAYLYRLTEERTANTTRFLVSSMDLNFEGLIDSIDIGLQASADEMSRLISAGKPDVQSISSRLEVQHSRLSHVAFLRATNEHGDLMYGKGVLSPPNNNSDRDYFIHLRNDPKAGLFINKPVLGRVEKKWVWTFVRRINKPDGTFGGVVVAGVNIEEIQKMLEQFPIGSSDTIAIRDANYGLIVRNESGSTLPIEIGDKQLSKPFADALNANPQEGTYISGSTSIDGVSRTHSYLRNSKYGFTINAGLSRDASLAVWRKQAWATGVLVFIFILTAVAYVRLTFRSWLRQENSLKALEASELLLRESQITAAVGSYIVDINSGLWKSSALLDQIFGIEENYDRSVKGWEELIHPDDRFMMHEYFVNEVVGKRVNFDKEYRIIRHSDQAMRWVHGTGKLEFDSQNNPVKMLGAIQDITEHKEADILLRESEQRYRSLFNNAEVAMFRSRLDGSEILDCNEKFLEVVGRTKDEIIGKPSTILWADPHKRLEMVSQLNAKGHVADFEYGMLTPKGELRYCVTSLRLFREEGLLEGSIRDITAQMQAEEALRQSESRLRVMVENEVVGIVTSKDRIIQWANPAYEKLLGYERGELNGVSSRVIFPDDAAYLSLAKKAYPVINEGKVFRTELIYQRKDGSHITVDLSGGLLPETGETLWACVDVTQRKKAETELSLIAHYDVLTGIPNRVLLADRMKQAIAQTSREQNMMAICYLDLDGFKPVNDTFGHEAGDEVLVEIANRIGKTIRGGDTVARLGGDEFVVLLLGQDRGEECVATLERLLEAISQPITVKGKPQTVSASIGVSIYPLDNEDPDTLLRHSDQAMYVAKQSGKNRFHIYDPAMDKRARDQQDFLKNIRYALEQNQFELHYQPKVNLRTKELVGAEALIRWRHPERGLLSPAEFLRFVENTDLDIAIGEWVTATALTQMNHWQSAGLDIEVSINISGYHMESSGFVEKLGQQLAQYPDMPQGKLQIEVLETVALNDIAVVREIIETCREIGVGFALDDFGTGYSSLSYLSGLPVDALKIDQSFVRDMLEDKGDMAIVQGIIALAKAFDRHTVAEGIETMDHYHVLLEMGCELGQGYGIARPMPASEITKWKLS